MEISDDLDKESKNFAFDLHGLNILVDLWNVYTMYKNKRTSVSITYQINKYV